MTVKLVIFDVDGTILKNSSWQHIHHNLNTWSQAKKHSDQFFRNEITYEQWAKLDAALWKNQPLARINQLIKGMPYMKGAKETLATLKSKGLKVYLLSAGLTRVAHRIQSETWVDGSTANTLIVEDGCLTGEVEVSVSFYNKNKHLRPILQKFHLAAKETAAIGDDPTLIPLFEKVAFSIAFNPVDRSVEKSADIAINSNDLRDVLPYILEQG